jgi:hypothetical protein
VLPKPWLGDGKDFCVDLTGWIHLKRRFDLLISLAERGTSESRRNISEFFRDEGWHQYDAGHIHLGLDSHVEKRLSGEVNEVWDPQIVTDSLYHCFVAMVWLDVAVKGRRLLRCANATCGRPFSTDKRNKNFCQNSCAQAVSRRKWWNEKGALRRKTAGELKSVPTPNQVVGSPAQKDTGIVKAGDNNELAEVKESGGELGGHSKGSTSNQTKKGGN